MSQVTSLSPEQAAARKRYVGGSEIASLFGCGYKTELELWLEKAGQLDPEPLTAEWIEGGTFMEPGIAAWVAHRTGYKLEKVTRHCAHPTVAGWGASLDYEIVGHADGPGVAQIKRVNWFLGKKAWVLEPGEEEAPPHIELQLQHEMGAIDYDWGLIGADIGGTLRVIERPRDPNVQLAIADRVGAFWDSIKAGTMPEPNPARDLATLKRLWPTATIGKWAPFTDDLAQHLHDLETGRAYARAGETLAEAAATAILWRVRDAEGVQLPDGNILSAVVTKRKGYVVADTSYRQLKVAKPKAGKGSKDKGETTDE